MLPAWARVVSFYCCSLLGASALAQPAIPTFDAELDPWTTGDGAGGDNFGKAIAQDGDWLAVGAPGNVLPDPMVLTGTSQGTVYLYRRDGSDWTFEQTLLVPDAINGATFGLALAMRGDLLVAAAPRSNRSGPTDAGEVHLYRRDAMDVWQLETTLQSPMPGNDGNFGHALLLLSVSELVIGAPGESDRGLATAGAVYRYTESAGLWQPQARIIAESAEAGARFGSALTGWAGNLLVGVPNAGLDDAGAVDLVALPSGTATMRVSSPFGAQAQFGTALDASSGRLLAAAPNATVAALDGAGAVALYRDSDLLAAPELLNSQAPEIQGRYGDAVRIAGTRLLIAAPQADVPPGFDEGVVEYYDASAPIALFQGSLSNPFPGLSGRLGKTIVVDDSDGGLLLGADQDKVGPNNGQGSVSIFPIDGNAYGSPVRLTRGDGAYLERFSSAVSVDRQWAAVSSFLERTEDGAEAGAVYLYRRVAGQWQRHQRLLSPDPAVEQRFGAAVSLVGDRLLIGAYWDASLAVDSGAAYLFELVNDSWTLSATFRSPTPVLEGHFGFSVALDPTAPRLLIGEPGANTPNVNQGMGHVYQFDGNDWVLDASLVTVGSEIGAEYGTAVAIEGDTALLGGPLASTLNIAEAGAVARFRRTGNWQFDARLQPLLPSELAHFGQSVALSALRTAVSAPQESVGTQTAAGAIYVMRGASFFERLVASDARAGDRLGSQLALCGERLLAGAPGVDRDQQFSQGALYVWADRSSSWQALPRFLTPNGGGLEGLGLSTACDGEIGFGGAPFKAAVNPQEGRAYSVAIGNLFADGFE